MTRLETSQFLKDMVDELVLWSKNDPELARAINWLDTTTQFGKDADFYQRVVMALISHEADKNAKNWNKYR